MSWECAIEACDRPARKRGLCAAHYDRWRMAIELDSPIGNPGRRPRASSAMPSPDCACGDRSRPRTVFFGQAIQCDRCGRRVPSIVVETDVAAEGGVAVPVDEVHRQAMTRQQLTLVEGP